jgi:hypothetical protein
MSGGGVLEFRGAKAPVPAEEHEVWLRRQAVSVALQLPENQSDALAVLGLAGELIRDFLNGPKRS